MLLDSRQDSPEDFPESDEFKDVYRHGAEAYDRLVEREDYRGNVIAALNEIRPLHGLRIVEFGAGTGRLTRGLSVTAEQIAAFDIAPAMLSRACENMRATGMTNWSVALGDNLRMPVRSGCADLALEDGASTTFWLGIRKIGACESTECWPKWSASSSRAAPQFCSRQWGRAQTAKAPNRRLEALYQYWQEACGFQFRWVRSDYRFASPAESLELMRGVFSESLTTRWLDGGKVILPQCTGIWWKHFPKQR